MISSAIWTDVSRMNANEIQIPYDKHHKVSSLVKVTKTHTIDLFRLYILFFQCRSRDDTQEI